MRCLVAGRDGTQRRHQTPGENWRDVFNLNMTTAEARKKANAWRNQEQQFRTEGFDDSILLPKRFRERKKRQDDEFAAQAEAATTVEQSGQRVYSPGYAEGEVGRPFQGIPTPMKDGDPSIYSMIRTIAPGLPGGRTTYNWTHMFAMATVFFFVFLIYDPRTRELLMAPNQRAHAQPALRKRLIYGEPSSPL
jgi:hypothetical protein